jgi:hypothetical protein
MTPGFFRCYGVTFANRSRACRQQVRIKLATRAERYRSGARRSQAVDLAWQRRGQLEEHPSSLGDKSTLQLRVPQLDRLQQAKPGCDVPRSRSEVPLAFVRIAGRRENSQVFVPIHGESKIKGYLCVVTTYRCGNRRNYAKTINRKRYKSLHLRWRQAEKLRNLRFRRTDD